MTTQLSRATHGRPAAPVRMVHLGLGNFTRAHQAWYTEHASDADEWGIAAFTGRRPTMSEILTPQDGLYTLITKGAEGDSYEVISSVSHVHPASDFAQLVDYFVSPELAVVTSTVTEAGYYRAADGSLDVANAEVAADLEAIKGIEPTVEAIKGLTLTTAPVRVAMGLMARRAAGEGKLTVLPCDNIPDNGPSFGRVIRDAAAAADPSLPQWIDENVSFATCMVDRITPATTDDEIADVEKAQGYKDASPVPTEPFNEWVIQGDFPAGHPDWKSAGAQIVDDVEPFEQRKLWMLNGSHSLMAYVGPILGVETVYDAINDERIRPIVLQWWEEAGPGLDVPWQEYAQALIERYENASIRHLLAQIAADGSQKIPVRIAPTLKRHRGEGKLPMGAITAVAAWTLHLRGLGAPVKDAAADKVQALVGGELKDDVKNVVAYVAPELTDDAELIDAVTAKAEELQAQAK